MKFRLIVSIILIITLVSATALPGLANASKNNAKSQNIFVTAKQGVIDAFQNVGNFFKGVKTETVQNTKTAKKNVAKDSKKTKNKAVQNTKTTKKKVVNDFKNAKSKVKKDVKNAKKNVVNGFKSLKK